MDLQTQEKNEVIEKINETEIISQITESVNKLLCSNSIKITSDIIPENAIKYAFFVLQETVDKNGKNALQTCTKASIQKAILKMLVLGLDPSKRQCYFIPYGNRLELVISYFGKIALAKRCGMLTVAANVVYKDDVFSIYVDKETGFTKLSEHIPNLQSKDIIGAYAVITMKQNEEKYSNLVYMSIDEIKKCWMINKLYSITGEGIHSKFPEEMCKKTVISRALKLIINSSYDVQTIDEDDITKEDEKQITIVE